MAQVLQTFLAARGLSWSHLRDIVEDERYIAPSYCGPELSADTDIWGIHRHDVGYDNGCYQEIDHYPLAGVDDPRELADYPWPHPNWFDYATGRVQAQQEDKEHQFAHKFFAANPFETYCWLTGLEESLMNMLVNPALVTSALEYITGFFIARLTHTLTACGDLIDIVFIADDLGGQQGLLISHANYRDLLQPFHQQLTDVVHRLAPHAKIMFHSDGSVFDLLPDLIDSGVQILEAVQVDAAKMNPVALKETFGDQLCFHGAISVQQLLPHATPAIVESECRHLVDILGADGGYIAAPTHAIQVGTPPENVLAMLHAILGEQDYAQALALATM
jgi:uroporphyrinogen decarboxylase